MSHFYPDIHYARLDSVFERLKHMIVKEQFALKAEIAVTPEPVPFDERLSLKYKPIALGEAWGKAWDCAWIHVMGEVPKSFKGAYVTLNFDFGGELLLFDNDGNTIVGLTNGSVFEGGYQKDHYHFLKSAKGGEKIDLWIDAAANHLFGVTVSCPKYADGSPVEDRIEGKYCASCNACHVCRFDYETWQLHIDLDVLRSLHLAQPEGSAKSIRTLRNISKALDLLPEERGGVKAVRKALRETIYSIPPDPGAIHVSAIGHAHIDTAWLWPLRETVRKVGRTWSSQISNIKRYPGFKFGASQAQLYKYCKENYPKLYEKVKKAVANGDWELQGGMWVEADCNIPSGESLVRQFLVGMQYFNDEFGKVPRNLWLPDVFGYSGNLPQIMRVCGIDFFLTQKLSWSKYNKFPHNTFVWEGIDGSRVVSHFPPEDTYNASLMPHSLMRHETNNREAGIVDEAISLFGMGDGGGGPKEEYVEYGLRSHALNGCPRVDFAFAQDAFDRIVKLEDELDTWRGELYFEMHRGTYTTQARQKLLNRRAEEAMRLCEMLSAMCDLNEYPQDEIRSMWEDILVNQFHDIIPGSSINRVYREGNAMLKDVIAKAGELTTKAAAKLLKQSKDSVTFFNPSSTPYDGIVALPLGWKGMAYQDGEALPMQREGDIIYALISVPPCSFVTYKRMKSADVEEVTVKSLKGKSEISLSNERVAYLINKKLQVISAVDCESGVEFITKAAPGNALALYDDYPTVYDAWELEEYARNMQVAEPKDIEWTLVSGPIRSYIDATFKLGESSFKQRIVLSAVTARLDFETSVDWQENHRLCSVAFPVEVRADEATYEIQYGRVKRATHDNTKWQYAQFESCGHRYADLSDNYFGVALLNDSKYGYRIKGQKMELSLLRSSTHPDPVADKGDQNFTYSIMPHGDNIAYTDEVVKAAAELNQGVVRFDGYECGEFVDLPVSYDGEGVELAVLKKAEKGNDLIVRLVERNGCHAQGTLTVNIPGAKITPCLANELEDIGESVEASAGLCFEPYEIKTFRIEN